MYDTSATPSHDTRAKGAAFETGNSQATLVWQFPVSRRESKSRSALCTLSKWSEKYASTREVKRTARLDSTILVNRSSALYKIYVRVITYKKPRKGIFSEENKRFGSRI